MAKLSTLSLRQVHSNATEKGHFSCLYSWSCSFVYYPNLVTIGEIRNKDQPVNRPGEDTPSFSGWGPWGAYFCPGRFTLGCEPIQPYLGGVQSALKTSQTYCRWCGPSSDTSHTGSVQPAQGDLTSSWRTSHRIPRGTQSNQTHVS